MCTTIMVSLFSFPNGSDPPYWGFLTVECTRVQWTVLWVSTNVYSAYHHRCNPHQGCFLFPTSSLVCSWHAALSHPGPRSHWSPLPRAQRCPFQKSQRVTRLCPVHLSPACVISATERYSVLCGHEDSHSVHSPDGRWSIKRVPLSILLTLFLQEHSFKISIKCIFFSFFYKQRVWCPL